MITLNQIIYNLRNLTKDIASDDIKLSDRQYEFIVDYIRAELINQDITKGKSISDNIKQDLGIINFNTYDSAESVNINTGKNVLRSTVSLPKFVETNQKDMVTYIGGIDKVSPIQFTTRAQAAWSKYSKYASLLNQAYLRDKYIYLVGCPTRSKKLFIEGVFESPREATEFKENRGYRPDTDAYPISGKMLRTLYKLIKDDEFSLLYKLKDDIRNDASEEIRTP